MGKIRFFAALWAAKAARLAMRLLGRNATYLPGSIAIKLCPQFLGYVKKPGTVVAVTGTNGKTTVCNMLGDILRDNGYTLLDNRYGSNTNSGVASSLLAGVTACNRSRFDFAVFEVDERSSLLIYKYVKPDYLLITNLFRDSVKRNAHTEFISGILNDAIPDETTLILNADDLISGRIKPRNQRVYFGIDPLAGELQQRDSIIQDLRSCPACGAPVQFEFQRYHHIGRVRCACGFSSPAPDYAVSAVEYGRARMTVRDNGGEEQYHLVNNSIFNIYNEVAVIALLRVLGLDAEKIRASMEKIQITDTRYVEQYAGGVKLVAHIAKGQNPIACSRVFEYVSREPGDKVVFIMVDDIYDNKDTSENLTWIYETDFEFLNRDSIRRIYVGGPRSQDYRLRMLLAGIPDERITAFRHERDFLKYADLSGVDSVYILYDLYQYDLAMKLKDETAAALEALSAAKDGGETA